MLGKKVWDLATQRFKDISAAQYKKGWEKYGKALVTFNGRDPFKDAREEIVDMHQYLTQAEEEFSLIARALYFYAITEGFWDSIPSSVQERIISIVKDEKLATILPQEWHFNGSN